MYSFCFSDEVKGWTWKVEGLQRTAPRTLISYLEMNHCVLEFLLDLSLALSLSLSLSLSLARSLALSLYLSICLSISVSL